MAINFLKLFRDDFAYIIHMCIICVKCLKSPERVLGSLGLDLPIALSYNVRAENWTRSSGRAATRALNCWSVSLSQSQDNHHLRTTNTKLGENWGHCSPCAISTRTETANISSTTTVGKSMVVSSEVKSIFTTCHHNSTWRQWFNKN